MPRRIVTTTVLLALLIAAPVARSLAGPGVPFVRGECNADGAIDVADPIHLLAFLFGGGSTSLECEVACDANGDDSVDIGDAVSLLGYLFQPGSSDPPAPFPDCGTDPVATLGCTAYPPCASVPPLDGFGDITGDIDVLDVGVLTSTIPAYFATAIDFGADPFDAGDESLLTPGGQIIYNAGTIGVSALLSEVFAYEVLARSELATLLKLGSEILVVDPQGARTDLLVEIEGLSIGVDIRRAFVFPPTDPLTMQQAGQLFADAFDDINNSTMNVDPVDAWQKQILCVVAYDGSYEPTLFAAWSATDPVLRDDTVVLVIVTDGDDAFIY